MRETFEHKLGKLNNDLIRMGGMIEGRNALPVASVAEIGHPP